MSSRKIRYFHAGTDVGKLAYVRKSQLTSSRSRKPNDKSDDKHGVSTSRPTCSDRLCQPDSHCEAAGSSCAGCPSWTFSQQPPRTSKAFVRWCMSTKACYLPMLQPGYTCDAAHMLAIQGKRAFRRLVDYLRENPKALNSRDSMGNTPLMLACAAHDEPDTVVRFLLVKSRQSLVRAENKEGLTALHFAVLNDRPDVVKLLLKRRARVDAGSRQIGGRKYGLTPLHLTLIDHGQSKLESNNCFHILLDHGADVCVEMVEASALDSDGAKLLYECDCGGCWSVNFGFDFLVPPALIRPRFLLASAVPDCCLQTALGPVFNVAVYLNNYWQVKALLRRFPRIDVNFRDGYHSSPLDHAVDNCNAEMIRLLINNGANVNSSIPDNDNTPLHLLLSNHRRQLETNLLCAWCNGTAVGTVDAVYDSLLDCRGLAVNAKNKSGKTPLCLAVSRGHVYACRRLLEMGASPTEADSSGRSLLSRVCDLQPASVRKAMLGLLLTTGLAHQVQPGPYRETEPLRTVFNNLDTGSLVSLHCAGAVTWSVLKQMLADTERRLAVQTTQDSRAFDRFRETLKTLLRGPQSLRSLVLVYFSRRAGRGPPEHRARALRTYDPEPPDGDAFTFVLSCLKDANFL